MRLPGTVNCDVLDPKVKVTEPGVLVAACDKVIVVDVIAMTIVPVDGIPVPVTDIPSVIPALIGLLAIVIEADVLIGEPASVNEARYVHVFDSVIQPESCPRLAASVLYKPLARDISL